MVRKIDCVTARRQLNNVALWSKYKNFVAQKFALELGKECFIG